MEQLAEGLKNFLLSDSYLKNYKLSVKVQDSRFVVEGSVGLYHHKQIINHVAFNFIEKNSLDFSLDNRVEVLLYDGEKDRKIRHENHLSSTSVR